QLAPAPHRRQRERAGLASAVQQEQERVAGNGAPAVVDLVAGLAVYEHAERMRVAAPPVLGSQLCAVGAQPGDVLRAVARDRRATEEAPPAEHRMAAAEREQLAREREQRGASPVEVPVHPA